MPLNRDESKKLTEIHTIVTQQLAPWVKDHEDRIRKVEKTQFKALGAFSALTVLINSFITWFHR